MSLTRYHSTVAKTGTPAGFDSISWTQPGGGPIRTYTARGPGGGVETVIGDDTYVDLTILPPSGCGVILSLAPIATSDYISKLDFVIRARIGFVPGDGISTTTTIKIRRAGVDYTIGTSVVTEDGTSATRDPYLPGSTAAFTTRTISTSVDPATGVAWDPVDFTLSTPWSPGVTTSETTETQLVLTFDADYTTFAPTYQISAVYVASETAIGPTDGPRRIRDNWRWCDVCARKTPYARILRPTPPHPQAGLAICQNCLDEPDHDTNKILSKSFPRDKFDTLY